MLIFLDLIDNVDAKAYIPSIGDSRDFPMQSDRVTSTRDLYIPNRIAIRDEETTE